VYIRKSVTWDPRKAVRNVAKHGVAFEDAIAVFVDADALDWDDRDHSDVESRRKRIGRSVDGRVILVVYTIRRPIDEEETIRIISARQASRKEREAYAR
jgi:uncharacterized DUF497 family protein